MIILGIETSCDETSVAIIKDHLLLSNIVISQLDIHKNYGGVVPEIASRNHEKNIIICFELAVKESKIKLEEIDCIAVTYGPGLLGALLVGINFAKGLSLALNTPMVGINHMEGHLFAGFINRNIIQYPFLCLLVSGGHTQICIINEFRDYKIIANTVDDAAGEAFDKGARILGLDYPGGPAIEKNSRFGESSYFNFPRPKVKNHKYNFSFSGLKTSLLYTTKKLGKKKVEELRPHLASSYQEAIIDVLINRLQLTITDYNIKNIMICGGVASNKRFRNKINDNNIFNSEINIIFPEIKFCTDNAAMIAYAGKMHYCANLFSQLSLTPNPNLSLDIKKND